MTVTLTRKPFTKEERAIMVEAIMTGAYIEGLPELDAIAIEIAERLPALLKHVGLPDNSDNRRRIIELVMVRWGMPKTPTRSRAYRALARGGRFRSKGRP